MSKHHQLLLDRLIQTKDVEGISHLLRIMIEADGNARISEDQAKAVLSITGKARSELVENTWKSYLRDNEILVFDLASRNGLDLSTSGPIVKQAIKSITPFFLDKIIQTLGNYKCHSLEKAFKRTSTRAKFIFQLSKDTCSHLWQFLERAGLACSTSLLYQKKVDPEIIMALKRNQPWTQEEAETFLEKVLKPALIRQEAEPDNLQMATHVFSARHMRGHLPMVAMVSQKAWEEQVFSQKFNSQWIDVFDSMYEIMEKKDFSQLQNLLPPINAQWAREAIKYIDHHKHQRLMQTDFLVERSLDGLAQELENRDRIAWDNILVCRWIDNEYIGGNKTSDIFVQALSKKLAITPDIPPNIPTNYSSSTILAVHWARAVPVDKLTDLMKRWRETVDKRLPREKQAEKLFHVKMAQHLLYRIEELDHAGQKNAQLTQVFWYHYLNSVRLDKRFAGSIAKKIESLPQNSCVWDIKANPQYPETDPNQIQNLHITAGQTENNAAMKKVILKLSLVLRGISLEEDTSLRAKPKM